MCTECLKPSRLVSIILIFVIVLFYLLKSFPSGSDIKESACNAGDLGSIPGMGRSLGEGNGNPLQCSCLENPMDRGAWRAAVHGVTELDMTEWLSLSLLLFLLYFLKMLRNTSSIILKNLLYLFSVFFPVLLFNPSGIYFYVFFQVSYSYLFLNFIYLFLPHLILFNKTWQSWDPLLQGQCTPSRGTRNLQFGVYNSQTCL